MKTPKAEKAIKTEAAKMKTPKTPKAPKTEAAKMKTPKTPKDPKTTKTEVANGKGPTQVFLKFPEKLTVTAVKELIEKYGDCGTLDFGWYFNVYFDEEKSARKFKESAKITKLAGLTVTRSKFALNKYSPKEILDKEAAEALAKKKKFQPRPVLKKEVFMMFDEKLTSAAVKELFKKYKDCELDFGRHFTVHFDDEESALKYKESTMEIAGLTKRFGGFTKRKYEKEAPPTTEEEAPAKKKVKKIKSKEEEVAA